MPDPVGDKIPFQEAQERGLLPCASCGAPGGRLRGGHLLCDRCSRRSRAWLGIAALLVALAAGLGLVAWVRSRPATPPPGSAERTPEDWGKETARLIAAGRNREARDRCRDLLEAMPDEPALHFLMGKSLMGLRHHELAIAHFRKVLAAPRLEDNVRQEVSWRLGVCLKEIGRVSEALPFLEAPLKGDEKGRPMLAELYLDLERYDDALALLPVDPFGPGPLWARHRALLYGGKLDEAAKVLEGRDPVETARIRSSQLREAGDFDGARRALEPLARADDDLSLRRAELSIAIESGDAAAAEKAAGALASSKEPQAQGEGIFGRAVAQLLGGRGPDAKASAWEFLAKVDPDYSPLRLERMMMRRLVGELKDADLEEESKRLTRFHANDLHAFLALATGDPAWAVKGLAATPGSNFPLHLLRRLAGE